MIEEFTKWLRYSARYEAEKYFDKEKLICIIPRETIWYSICLLESQNKDDRDLANRILENIVATDGTHSQSTLIVIYYKYYELLTQKAINNIFKNINDSFPVSAYTRFSDGNVNHPLGAYCNLICGGEILGVEKIMETGEFYLKEFYKTITKEHKTFRQSQLSEYLSPTYTALSIWFLNIISKFSKNVDIRALAIYLEESLWFDVALHFHAPSMQFSGPFSRAYLDDSVGGYSALHCTMIKALGKMIYFNPEVSYKINHASNFIQNALISILDFNLPPDFYNLAFHKKFPLYFKQKTFCEQYFENGKKIINDIEKSTFDDECYPGGWSDLTTYLTDEFTLGTAERQYVNGGHSDTFVFRYRRNDKITNLFDFRSIHTRGVYNDSVVGEDNFCHACGYPISKDFLYEEGRNAIFQDKNRAIVTYFPKRCGCSGVENFRLDLICNYYSEFDSLFINNTKISDFPVEFSYEDIIFIQDSNVFFAIIPFKREMIPNYKNKIWVKNKFFIISLYSFTGDKRDFTREEINLYNNGFIFEASEKKKFTNFKKFRDYISLNKITKKFLKNEIIIEYSDRQNSMKMVYDCFREKMIERKLNGKEAILNSFYIETEDKKLKNLLKNGIFIR